MDESFQYRELLMAAQVLITFANDCRYHAMAHRQNELGISSFLPVKGTLSDVMVGQLLKALEDLCASWGQYEVWDRLFAERDRAHDDYTRSLIASHQSALKSAQQLREADATDHKEKLVQAVKTLADLMSDINIVNEGQFTHAEKRGQLSLLYHKIEKLKNTIDYTDTSDIPF